MGIEVGVWVGKLENRYKQWNRMKYSWKPYVLAEFRGTIRIDWDKSNQEKMNIDIFICNNEKTILTRL